jgi:hypothetical protein
MLMPVWHCTTHCYLEHRTPNGAEDQDKGDDIMSGQIDSAAGMEDLDDPDDSNYMPESKEDTSLGPNELDVPEDFLDLESFRRQLISSAQSIKRGCEKLKADQDTLNDKWVEVLTTKQDLE